MADICAKKMFTYNIEMGLSHGGIKTYVMSFDQQIIDENTIPELTKFGIMN